MKRHISLSLFMIFLVSFLPVPIILAEPVPRSLDSETTALKQELIDAGHESILNKLESVIFGNTDVNSLEATRLNNVVYLVDVYHWYQANDDMAYAGVRSVRSPYSSKDRNIAREQLREIQDYLGSDAVIFLDWPGLNPAHQYRRDALDVFLSVKDEIGSPLRFGFLFEHDNGHQMGFAYDTEGRIDYSLLQNQVVFAREMTYLNEHYFSRPDIFRPNGKPVIYGWTDRVVNLEYAKKIAEALCPSGIFYLNGENIFNTPDFGNTNPVIDERLLGSDGVAVYLSYSPDLIKKYGAMNENYIYALMLVQMKWIDYLRQNAPWVEYIPTVSFNYDDTHLLDRQDANGNPLNPPMFSTPESRVLLMRATIALIDELGIRPYICVGTYNELWEGSGIEKSLEYGDDLLLTLKEGAGK